MSSLELFLAWRILGSKRMTVGTRTLLFGIHHWLIHPLFIIPAWRKLYNCWPSWRELICIFIHDWGYWGKRGIDWEDGPDHPQLGAGLANWLFGEKYFDFVLFHSRTVATTYFEDPSKLCWADKRGTAMLPVWVLRLLGFLSGESKEYVATYNIPAKEIYKKFKAQWLYSSDSLDRLGS